MAGGTTGVRTTAYNGAAASWRRLLEVTGTQAVPPGSRTLPVLPHIPTRWRRGTRDGRAEVAGGSFASPARSRRKEGKEEVSEEFPLGFLLLSLLSGATGSPCGCVDIGAPAQAAA